MGSFNLTQLGDTADKIGKDTNFRGLAIFDNVVYFSKGSGGNGINTVYFIDTTGQACPSTSQTPGIGIPESSATLPTTGIAFDASLLQTEGVVPYNMCVLKGFLRPPTNSDDHGLSISALWFADSTTLYVADEGDGTFADAGTETTAGLQEWIFDAPHVSGTRVYFAGGFGTRRSLYRARPADGRRHRYRTFVGS